MQTTTLLILALAGPSFGLHGSSSAGFGICSPPGLDRFYFNPVCAGARTGPELGHVVDGILPCLLDGTCTNQTRKNNGAASAATHPINKLPLWSHKPRCIREESSTVWYCVYTSPTFANNRGVSIFTTPEEMQKLSDLPAFKDSTVHVGINQELDPPYVAKRLPGRGVGLIANRTLQRGDPIFSFTPVYMVHNDIHSIFANEDRFRFQHTAIQRLPDKSQKAFMDLCGHFGGDHVDDVINTNSFGIDMWESEAASNEKDAGNADGERKLPSPSDDVEYSLVFPEISVRLFSWLSLA
jgi:hypothetical protein